MFVQLHPSCNLQTKLMINIQVDGSPAPRMKQLLAYLFSWNAAYEPHLRRFRKLAPTREEYMDFVDDICTSVRKHHQDGGLSSPILVNHMTLAKEKRTPNVEVLL